MKLASFEIDGRQSFGAVKEDKIVDLSFGIDAIRSLRGLLAADAVEIARNMAEDAIADYDLAEVTLLPTIPDAEKYICIGVNYGNRSAEYEKPVVKKKYPNVFMRSPGSFVGHNVPIVRPPESEQLDYEGEIAIVIGKAGRRIPEANALSYIAGLTLLNEGSIRDWMRHGTFNITQGKNFEQTGSIGPWMVTADEFAGYGDLDLKTEVNGEIRQQDNTAHLIFDFAYLISYLSSFYHLKPGDVIATGTPTGAGARFDPPRFLVPGDVVEIDCPSIGILSNPVIDEIV